MPIFKQRYSFDQQNELEVFKEGIFDGQYKDNTLKSSSSDSTFLSNKGSELI
jgi:hypothetical protein